MSPVAGIPGYSTVWTLGHPRIADLLQGEVVVQEKLDGWQMAFGWIGGRLRLRSKEAEIDPKNPPEPYAPAVAAVRSIAQARLGDGVIYRGEAMASPRAHRLPYHRAPRAGFLLWDIQGPDGWWREPILLESEAAALGFETPPILYHGPGEALTMEQLEGWLGRESFLGGPPIEGVVVKNYVPRYRAGKFVTHRFREVRALDGRGGVLDQLIRAHRTSARWEKAAQHLEARGALKYDHGDFIPLREEIVRDILAECSETILQALPVALRNMDNLNAVAVGATEGIKEWWGRELIRRQLG